MTAQQIRATVALGC